ncbi:MAG: energy transducer TonB [Maricaulaceae bacterium]|jgi:TonB family protein
MTSISHTLRSAAACVGLLLLAACIGGGGRVFEPKSDYGFPPDPEAYSEPGDCQGGSRLAAVDLEEPEYPRRAFRQGLQGWVALRLDVDPDGRTRNVRVIEAQPDGPFNGAARGTVRSWRFEPPGEPGLERCVVVLDYRLGVGRIGI